MWEEGKKGGWERGRETWREGEKKTEEPLTLSPQALGTRAGVAALGPEQARVPRREGAEGAGQAVPAVSTTPPSPDLAFPFPAA